ncbi:MAG: hypothetical protein ABSC14_03830 [Desulfomonilia bacterium]|jgi:hypothetical protein
MASLTNFKAVYCSGLFIQENSTVSALSLLFEKIYLPKNISIIEEFAKKYEFVGDVNDFERNFFRCFGIEAINKFNDLGKFRMTNKNTKREALSKLSDKQRETAYIYIQQGIGFAGSYRSLFPDIFESNFFEGIKITSHNNRDNIKENEKKITLNISYGLDLTDSDDKFSQLVEEGYIPIVDNNWSDIGPKQHLDEITAKQIASLLAMKSINIVFPRTKGVHPEIILEARDRLSDYLPPFWSAMLKLTVEMRRNIRDCTSMQEMFKESQFLVDTLVMPALIDLKQKMIKERKNWFYRILSPIQKGLRFMIGNPPLTQQQLLTNALVLGSDVIMSTAENMRTIEAMKEQAGLTFLLEAHKIISNETKKKKIQ